MDQIKPGEFYIHNRLGTRLEVLANNPARDYVVVSAVGSIWRAEKKALLRFYTLDPNQEP